MAACLSSLEPEVPERLAGLWSLTFNTVTLLTDREPEARGSVPCPGTCPDPQTLLSSKLS